MRGQLRFWLLAIASTLLVILTCWGLQGVGATPPVSQAELTASQRYSLECGRLESQGQYREAMIACNWAIVLNPQNGDAYYNRALVYHHDENHHQGIADFTMAITINPQDAEAFNNRGHCHSQLQELEAAIKDYTQGITLNPNYVEAYSNRGSARSQLGDKAGALVDLNTAIRLDPTFFRAYGNRGALRQESQDLIGAIADYSTALKLNPKYAQAYLGRSAVYIQQSAFVEAIADLTQVLTLDAKAPWVGLAYTSRAQAYVGLKDWSNALRDYARALEATPENATLYIRQAEIYQQLGNIPESKLTYGKALELLRQQGKTTQAQAIGQLIEQIGS